MCDNIIGKEVVVEIGDEEMKSRKRLAPEIHIFERRVEGKIIKRLTHSGGRILYLIHLNERLTDPGKLETNDLIVWPSMDGDKIKADLETVGISGVVLSAVPLGKEVENSINGYDKYPSFGGGKLYLKTSN